VRLLAGPCHFTADRLVLAFRHTFDNLYKPLISQSLRLPAFLSPTTRYHSYHRLVRFPIPTLLCYTQKKSANLSQSTHFYTFGFKPCEPARFPSICPTTSSRPMVRSRTTSQESISTSRSRTTTTKSSSKSSDPPNSTS
jgi:hypothetical protein